MKKLLIILFSIFLGSSQLYAQTLSSWVYDEVTGNPIADVYVYFNGTTYYTTTDDTGKFTLTANNKINAPLVISHVAYEAVLITNPFQDLPEKIYLKELFLGEVVVQGKSRFNRKQMLKAFRGQFLGDDVPGTSCKIHNEEDIRFFYDSENKILSAKSDKPLSIENRYLGYLIRYSLDTFAIRYENNTLNSNSAKRFFYVGTTSYVDLKPNDRLRKERRKKFYENSRRYFLKNFVNNTLDKTQFEIYSKDKKIRDINSIFTIKDTLSGKMVQINRNSNINKYKDGINDPIYGIIGIKFGKGNYIGYTEMKITENSEIIFLTNKFLIDSYGEYLEIGMANKILFTGKLAQQRVGSSLPIDFLPE